MIRSLILVTALFYVIAGPVHAAELQKVGEARLKVLVWPVYNSRLYSADGSYTTGQRPVRLEIEYLRAIDADDLLARTGEEWQRLGVDQASRQRWLERLAGLWPDVREGDVLSLLVDERDVSTFYFNGEPLGTLIDPDFGHRFLGIWLSPDTSRPELRLALLGKR